MADQRPSSKSWSDVVYNIVNNIRGVAWFFIWLSRNPAAFLALSPFLVLTIYFAAIQSGQINTHFLLGVLLFIVMIAAVTVALLMLDRKRGFTYSSRNRNAASLSPIQDPLARSPSAPPTTSMAEAPLASTAPPATNVASPGVSAPSQWRTYSVIAGMCTLAIALAAIVFVWVNSTGETWRIVQNDCFGVGAGDSTHSGKNWCTWWIRDPTKSPEAPRCYNVTMESNAGVEVMLGVFDGVLKDNNDWKPGYTPLVVGKTYSVCGTHIFLQKASDKSGSATIRYVDLPNRS